MADFNKAIEKLLSLEGGYVASDSTAGSSNFGITERFLRRIGDPRKPVDLTRGDAVELYRKHFWDPYRIGEFSDQALAEAFLAAVVNVGPAVALRLLSEAVGSSRPLGACRNLTRERADRARQRFRELLIGYYRRLAASNPSLYARYLDGWIRRAESC